MHLNIEGLRNPSLPGSMNWSRDLNYGQLAFRTQLLPMQKSCCLPEYGQASAATGTINECVSKNSFGD